MAAPVNLPVLAKTADVEALLGSSVTPAEDAMVAAMLRAASSLVRAFCRQTISTVTGDTLRLWPETLISDFWLPELPIQQIQSITPPGSALWDFNPTTGQVWLQRGQWLDPIFALTLDYTVLGPLEIVYDHGYDIIPDVIVDLIAGKVAQRTRMMRVNPEFLKGELIEGYRAYYFNDDPVLTLSAEEKAMLVSAGFRRYAAGSMSLR